MPATALFEWDESKNLLNTLKHDVSFEDAQQAFLDPDRLILTDSLHSQSEQRFFCVGKDKSGSGILSVRFTYRNRCIRIIGAGYWRRGRKLYEEKNHLH